MSRRGNTSRMNCELCGQNIGACGFSYVSHMRMHVRKGEATEHLTYHPTTKAAMHKYRRSCGCNNCIATFRKRQDAKFAKREGIGLWERT